VSKIVLDFTYKFVKASLVDFQFLISGKALLLVPIVGWMFGLSVGGENLL
jgi:hypothetical protein